MGIQNGKFRDGDVYIAYEHENVLFRYDHASRKSYRKFLGENQEHIVPHNNRLFNEAIRFGYEIDHDSYNNSMHKTARFAKASDHNDRGHGKPRLSASYTVLRVEVQHPEVVPSEPGTVSKDSL